jgi:hypothetical protein
MKARWIFIGALGGGAAVYLALGARTPVAPAPVVAEHRTVVVRQAAPSGAPHGAPASGVAVATVGDPTAAPAAAPELPSPTAEQSAAADAAMEIVDRAIAAGHWTDDDNTRLSANIRQVHMLDRDDVMQAWATAVNEQRLKVDVPPTF